MAKFLKTFRLVKVDEATHTVWGVAASEAVDSDQEICDYPAAKAAFQKWSDETLAKTSAAGQEPSLGNIRVMHQLQVGGKAIKIDYHDQDKEVWLGTEPASEDVWHLLKGGFLTGYSIGGDYDWKRPEGSYTRYAPIIGEVSYVDRPANPDASFAYVKSDGSTELRKFAKPGPEEVKLLDKLKKSETPLAKLSEADLERLEKSIEASLQKQHEQILAALEVAKGTNVKILSTDELQKASREELLKHIDELQKAHVPILDHLKQMHKSHLEHHADMHKAHTDHLNHHQELIDKCMKSVGHDGFKAESADELKKREEERKAEEARKAAAAGQNAELEALKKSVEEYSKRIEDLLKANDPTLRAKLTLVRRDGAEIKKTESDLMKNDEDTSKAVGY